MDQAFASFFDTKPQYERNNRSDGCKALRCFPRCNQSGHQRSGFCGRAATVEVHVISDKPVDYWVNCTLVVAEFRPFDRLGLSSKVAVPKTELLSALRTPISSGYTAESDNYYLGEISVTTQTPKNMTLHICFNRECNAWHYGWKSNKWVQGMTHVLDTVILEDTGGADLIVIASFLSNEFLITSTKKKRNDMKGRVRHVFTPNQIKKTLLKDDIKKQSSVSSMSGSDSERRVRKKTLKTIENNVESGPIAVAASALCFFTTPHSSHVKSIKMVSKCRGMSLSSSGSLKETNRERTALLSPTNQLIISNEEDVANSPPTTSPI